MPEDLDNHASGKADQVSPRGDGVEPPARPAWSDLTDEQRYILYETGVSDQNLICLLNGWVSGEDAVYWNRKGPYVALPAGALNRWLSWDWSRCGRNQWGWVRAA